MPDGSSSEAPVMRPGPRIRRTFFKELNIVTLSFSARDFALAEFGKMKPFLLSVERECLHGLYRT
jgi:hypothetical protein